MLSTQSHLLIGYRSQGFEDKLLEVKQAFQLSLSISTYYVAKELYLFFLNEVRIQRDEPVHHDPIPKVLVLSAYGQEYGLNEGGFGVQQGCQLVKGILDFIYDLRLL